MGDETMDVRNALQRLRDDCEGCCRVRSERGDKDSADCYERIALALDELQESIKHDQRIIDERRGLFPAR